LVSCPKESESWGLLILRSNISLIRKTDMEVILQDLLLTFEQICDLAEF
jgi:hypothetical protein